MQDSTSARQLLSITVPPLARALLSAIPPVSYLGSYPAPAVSSPPLVSYYLSFSSPPLPLHGGRARQPGTWCLSATIYLTLPLSSPPSPRQVRRVSYSACQLPVTGRIEDTWPRQLLSIYLSISSHLSIYLFPSPSPLHCGRARQLLRPSATRRGRIQ